MYYDIIIIINDIIVTFFEFIPSNSINFAKTLSKNRFFLHIYIFTFYLHFCFFFEFLILFKKYIKKQSINVRVRVIINSIQTFHWTKPFMKLQMRNMYIYIYITLQHYNITVKILKAFFNYRF